MIVQSTDGRGGGGGRGGGEGRQGAKKNEKWSICDSESNFVDFLGTLKTAGQKRLLFLSILLLVRSRLEFCTQSGAEERQESSRKSPAKCYKDF